MFSTGIMSQVKGGVAAAVVIPAILASSMFGAPAAFAADSQTGTGATSLVLKLYDTHERGGTEATGEFVNPDEDGDGLGDNLAFTVPVRIDFAVLADGTLVGPSESIAYIENESKYSAHVSALDADPKNGWNFVGSAASSSQSNSIDLQIGPSADKLDAASYLAKKAVSNPGKWNMAAALTSGTGDRVLLSTSGHVNHVDQNILVETTFGQLNWYVTPGTAN